MGKSRQELQTANHITSSKDQEESEDMHAHLLASVQLNSLTLIQFRTLCLRNGGLGPQQQLIKTFIHRRAHKPTQGRCSLLKLSSNLILGFIKSTVKANHHTTFSNEGDEDIYVS